MKTKHSNANGRKLTALALTAGTLLRVMAPLGDGFLYSGGTLWAAGWVLFVVLYGPMLIGRRADGAAG